MTNAPATPTTTPPDGLIPAAAGALVTRNVGDNHVEATVLDFARRGALAFEPEDDKKKIQVQLLDATVVENSFEEEVWKALESGADGSGLVVHEKLAGVRGQYGPAKNTLRQNMLDRGWFNPDVSTVRRPLYIAGTVALLLGIAGLIFSASSEQLWGLVGTIALGTAGFAAIIGAASFPATTDEGEAHAQPWRGYLKGVKDARNDMTVDVNLDNAMPYLVAMNASTELDQRLKNASEEGYDPAWLNSSAAGSSWGAAGFYPYWMTYHVVATSTGTASTGGASAGSGGSGGSF